jgi:dTDP-4-dehydrorhamnose 3,5-epimerase
MKSENLSIEGLKLITLDRFEDQRGYFFESYNEKAFNDAIGDNIKFVQDNVSYSGPNILRGLHFQLPPKSQGKYVQVLKGRVLDVVVDIRPDSSTFMSWESVELTESNGKALYIPPGFAHGFLVRSANAIFSYKVTEYYSKELDRSVNWSDPEFGIDWGRITPNLSEKDSQAPWFKDLKEEIIEAFSLKPDPVFMLEPKH